VTEPYYSDESVTIYHGDCLELLPELPLFDLLLTDPPYCAPAQHYASRAKWQRSWGDTSILSRWWGLVLDAALPRLNRTGHLVAFCDDESYAVFYPEVYRRFDLLASLVWTKRGFGMGATWRHAHELLLTARWQGSTWNGGGGLSDVLESPAVPSVERLHPVDKPLGLLGQLIEPTTSPGDLIVDPFLGGGSTLTAAKAAGRRCIGIEIEERYCEIAARRMGQEVLAL
jgi:site-specific DNA-methyltransferase (adenine-specific)